MDYATIAALRERRRILAEELDDIARPTLVKASKQQIAVAELGGAMHQGGLGGDRTPPVDAGSAKIIMGNHEFNAISSG